MENTTINLNKIKDAKRELKALNLLYSLGIKDNSLFILDNALNKLNKTVIKLNDNNYYIIG